MICNGGIARLGNHPCSTAGGVEDMEFDPDDQGYLPINGSRMQHELDETDCSWFYPRLYLKNFFFTSDLLSINGRRRLLVPWLGLHGFIHRRLSASCIPRTHAYYHGFKGKPEIYIFLKRLLALIFRLFMFCQQYGPWNIQTSDAISCLQLCNMRLNEHRKLVKRNPQHNICI